MKRLILTLVISCCIIFIFLMPVVVHAEVQYKDLYYAWNQNLGRKDPGYSTTCSKENIELIISAEIGTCEDVYYIAVPYSCYDHSEHAGEECPGLAICFMRDITARGIKGNVAYVNGKSGDIDTNYFNTIPYWECILVDHRSGVSPKWVEHHNSADCNSPNSVYCGYAKNTTKYNYQTNIPIFNTEEGLKDYFKTGNTDDIYGSTDLTYNSSIPYPTNLYMTYKVTKTCLDDDLLSRDTENLTHMRDFDFNLFFNLSEEAAECDVKIFYTANTRSYKWKVNPFSGLLFTQRMDKFDYVSPLLSSNLNSEANDFLAGEIKFNKFALIDTDLIFGNLELNNDYISFGSKETLITGYTFYLYCQKGSERGDIVSVSVNMSNFKLGDEYQKTPVTAPVDVNHYDGSNNLEDIVGGDVVSDDGYHMGNENPDYIDNYDNFISFITKGFGLLGNNGLISLLGNCFSFLPKEIIVLMTSTFAVICLVIVIKFVRG